MNVSIASTFQLNLSLALPTFIVSIVNEALVLNHFARCTATSCSCFRKLFLCFSILICAKFYAISKVTSRWNLFIKTFNSKYFLLRLSYQMKSHSQFNSFCVIVLIFFSSWMCVRSNFGQINKIILSALFVYYWNLSQNKNYLKLSRKDWA